MNDSAESTQRLDLRGLSGGMIEMQILRQFDGAEGRLHLDCLFDEDPNEALRDLERHCSQWSFQRIGQGHWVIRNFTQGFDAAFKHLGLSPTLKVPPYGGLERRERSRD